MQALVLEHIGQLSIRKTDMPQTASTAPVTPSFSACSSSLQGSNFARGSTW